MAALQDVVLEALSSVGRILRRWGIVHESYAATPLITSCSQLLAVSRNCDKDVVSVSVVQNQGNAFPTTIQPCGFQ